MKFRFNDLFFTLNQYLIKKINHFHDIKILNENIIVKYF